MSNNQSSKSRYSQRKQEISQAVQRHNNNRGRIAQRGANKEYKEAKAAYREAAKNYREGGGAEALKLKRKNKDNLRIARKTKKIVKKTNPTKTRQTVKMAGKTGLSMGSSYIETVLNQNEDTAEGVKALRTANSMRHSARKAGRSFGKVTKKTGKGVVKAPRFAKRSAKSAGRVAKRTAKNARRAAQASVKGFRRAVQVAQLAIKAAASAVNGAIAFFATPIGWGVAAVAALLLLIVIISGAFSSNIVQQTDFSLNDSWVQLSKTDRKKSNDKVEYYTDIDEILLYMNYRYGGEWEPSAKWEDGNGGKWAGKFGLNHFSDALDDIWKQENEDPNNLKTMKDVYTNGKEWTKLSKSDREEYEEILENAKESGKYPGMQELQNPLYNAADDKSQSEGVMIEKRYGYTAKDKFSYNTTIKASSGQKLYAPMDGKVEVGKSTLKTFKTNLPKDKKESEEKKQKTNIIIYTDDAEFIFYNVSGARVKSGDKIEEGTELGSVQGNGQEIAYAKRKETLDKDDKDDKRYYDEAKYLEKRDEDNEDARTFTRNVDKKGKKIDKWQIVNPGFYFPFVAYSQHTQVTTTETAGEMSGRAKQLYDLVKKSLPEATDNGIAAMAGCFGVESQIEPKRAEGDYLSPPVGA
ncbi:MAG: CHAP domain-containing protein, partial [Streptococcus salivarius]|nr:CHAP domain-containing protein [Streptococcus salivarius]